MTTHEHAACPVHADFDPLSPTFLADPFAVLALLPRETPVFYAPSIDYYVVTRYADIEAVFLDHETYSAAPAQLPLVQLVPEAAQILRTGGTAPQPSMVSLDQPARWDAVVVDPTLIPGAVDETLRYDPSVPVWRRVTKRPVTLGGMDVPCRQARVVRAVYGLASQSIRE